MPQDLINRASSIDPEITRQAYRLCSVAYTDPPPRGALGGGECQANRSGFLARGPLKGEGGQYCASCSNERAHLFQAP